MLSDVRQKNYVFMGQQKQPDVACDMDTEAENDVSRLVAHLVSHQNREVCLTAMQDDAQPHHLQLRPAQLGRIGLHIISKFIHIFGRQLIQ